MPDGSRERLERPASPSGRATGGPVQEEGRRYHVHEALGRGGFGTVYRADLLGNAGFCKQVALKILNPDLERADEVGQRLRDEARMLGMLRHRAIVQVDGLVQLDGRWAIVMEYIEGVDLKTLLRIGPLPRGAALEVVQEVAAALYVAYDRPGPHSGPLRLLHRDIKPANIQITSLGEVKVLDFGIARADFSAREAETRSMMFGSLLYMSPERLDFVDSHAGDIYALGATFYEMLTGDELGKTSSNEAKHRDLVDGAMARLADTLEDDDILELLYEMLEFDPDKRPSAKEVEKRIRMLRVRYPAGSLAEYADEVVPELMETRSPLPSDLDGSILVERGDGTPRRDEETRWEWVAPSIRAARKPGAASSLVPAAPVAAPVAPPPPAPPHAWLPALGVTLSLLTLAGTIAWVGIVVTVVTVTGTPIGRDSAASAAPSVTFVPVPAAGTMVQAEALPVVPMPATPMMANNLGGTLLPAGSATETRPAASSAAPREPAPKAEKRPAAPATTEVSFESFPPGARLSVDGRSLGITPLSAPIPPGAHEIAWTMDGYLPYAIDVEVEGAAMPIAATLLPKPAPAKVSVTGDATAVVLATPKERFPPGDVPPGTYRIKAVFPGWDEIDAGPVTLTAGTTLVLDCQSASLKCE